MLKELKADVNKIVRNMIEREVNHLRREYVRTDDEWRRAAIARRIIELKSRAV